MTENANKFFYRGHFVTLMPDHDIDEGVWLARVTIDVMARGDSERVYYTDHLRSYKGQEEALKASARFGKHIVDTFIVPTMGEGVPGTDEE